MDVAFYELRDLLTNLLKAGSNRNEIEAQGIELEVEPLEKMETETPIDHEIKDSEDESGSNNLENYKIARDRTCRESLYGLKQSLRQWDGRFKYYVTEIGLKRSEILIASKTVQEIKYLKLQLKIEFEMKDLGPVSKILGMDIIREGRKKLLHLIQTSYIRKVLDIFEMSNSNAVSTLLAQHFKLSVTQMPKDETEKSKMLRVPYASVVGSLISTTISGGTSCSNSVQGIGYSSGGCGHGRGIHVLILILKMEPDEEHIDIENDHCSVTSTLSLLTPILASCLHKSCTINHYEACLVAKGFQQQSKINFFETLSPVVKPSTIYIILSLAITHNWNIQQVDIDSAFLTLQEEVFMERPAGFVNPDFPTAVCKLNKAIYGLKQAPRAWFDKLKDSLINLGFTHSAAYTSLFFYNEGDALLFVLVYVNDILLSENNVAQVTTIITQMPCLL
uniref:Reverse transcriptase Ty1/copia-type domain-containing protein n=1 Tax=Cannabis sativa TaxID=3483 RepID=A0A803P5B1_CANSA